MPLMQDNLTKTAPDAAGDSIYRVKLEDIFEGPMDLLIHLIKKAEVDIYDIPIARITTQYLAYLEWMKQMNIDFAGDFVLMASTLTHIKSRMLLPLQTDEEAEEDPRLEITRPLLEYLRIKSAAEQLAERNLLGDKTFTRKPDSETIERAGDDQVIRIGLFELIDAFQNILDRVSSDHRVDLSRDRMSVQERMTQLTDLLEEKESLTFDELFVGDHNRSDIIVTFLAILEMARLSLIRIAQHVQTGIIRIFYL
ncbi:MAG: segregation/condensation protein A [Desulfosarcina sp.]|jgi:segregation and condensation protein A